MLVQDPIGVSIENQDGVVVLTVCGEVDLASASAFKSAIAEALAGDPQAVVIDLLRVELLGSIGVSILVEAHEKCNDDTRFAVAADRSVIGRLMQMLKLDEIFSVHETAADALAAVRTGKRADGPAPSRPRHRRSV